MLVLLFWTASCAAPEQSAAAGPTPPAQVSEAPIATATPPPPTREAPTALRQADVVSIIDGDSMKIRWLTGTDAGQTIEVRLRDINTPERDECWSAEAEAALTELAGTGPLSVDIGEIDRFGRGLVRVWDGRVAPTELDIGSRMVRDGHALVLSGGQVDEALFLAARESGAGMWSASGCQSLNPSQIRIGQLNHDAEGSDRFNRNGEWLDIVNDSTVDVALGGWGLRDQSTQHRYEFSETFVLAGRTSVRLHSGEGVDTSSDLYWAANDAVWNNGGDTALLIDERGLIVDVWHY